MPPSIIHIGPQLVSDLKAGDEQALKKILDLLGPKLLNYYKKQGLGQSDAEELLQDVFIRLWQFRKNLQTDTNFEAFFFTIARNTLLNFTRKQLSYELTETGCLEDIPAVATQFDKSSWEAVYMDYRRILEEVDQKRREVFVLSREEGLTHKQIAEKMGLPVRTVEFYISEMLRLLKTKLKDQYILLVLFLFR